jgi:hypothetical protein
MSVFYGVDISNWSGSGLPDLDPTGKLVTGNKLLAQALLNRLFCQKGSYLQSPNFGYDLMQFQNAAQKDINPSAIAAAIKIELIKDERVSDISCQVTFSQQVLRVKIQVTPNATGPFSLVMTLNQTVQPQNFEIIFNEAA